MASPEVGFLSACLRTGDAYTPANEGISPTMFEDHRPEADWLFGFIRKHGTVPSKSAFTSKFPEFRVLVADELEYWCGELKDDYAKRMTLTHIDTAMDLFEKGDTRQAVAGLSMALTKVVGEVGGNSGASLTEDYDDVLSSVREKAESEYDSAGWSTGFKTLDKITGGTHPGWLVVTGARLGQGKTWLLVRQACQMLIDGGVVLFHSLEMSRNEMALRFHAVLSRLLMDQGLVTEGFKHKDLMRGDVDLSAYEAFLRGLADHVPGQLTIIDTRNGSIGMDQIRSNLEAYQPDGNFIDYLTLLEMNGMDTYAIREVTRGLKICGQNYECVNHIAAQLNREATTGARQSGPEKLAGSDAIGWDSDLVITVAKPSASTMELYNAKFRHGPDQQRVWVKFKPNDGIVEECTYDQAQTLRSNDRDDQEY